MKLLLFHINKQMSSFRDKHLIDQHHGIKRCKMEFILIIVMTVSRVCLCFVS